MRRPRLGLDGRDHMALLHSDRIDGLVNMSVPFLPRGEVCRPAVQAAFGDSFSTSSTSRSGGADADLGRDPARRCVA